MQFFEPVWYNRVLVNWPRAHCGVLQLTEASYLGPDSPRTSPPNETVKQCRHQMTVANSPVQLFIFGIFEHKWGTRKHIGDLKKYSWCIPVQKEIKPIIWGAAITPEPWNRQQCWFIFEDPNVRFTRLSKPRDKNIITSLTRVIITGGGDIMDCFLRPLLQTEIS